MQNSTDFNLTDFIPEIAYIITWKNVQLTTFPDDVGFLSFLFYFYVLLFNYIFSFFLLFTSIDSLFSDNFDDIIISAIVFCYIQL